MTAKLPRLATVLLAVVLSLSIVAGPQARKAQALSPGWLAIGTALRAAPAALGGASSSAALGGTLATTGVVGLGVLGLVAVGYATKDSWLPVVEGWFGGQSDTSEAGFGAWGQVTAQFGAPNPWEVRVLGVSTTGNHGNVTGTRFDYTCQHIGNGSVRTGSVNKTVVIGAGSPATRDVAVCNNATDAGAGNAEKLVRVTINMISQFGGPITVTRAEPANNVTTTTVRCIKPTTGATATFTATETGQTDRVVVPSCEERWPGSVPDKIDVTAGAPWGPQETLTYQANPDVYEDYGDCFNELGLVCDIRVHVGGQPCAVGVPGCADWWFHRNDPEWDVSCRFGAHDVPLANCEALKRSYRPSAAPAGDPLTDPSAWPDPEWQPDPDASPSPSPSASPSSNPSGSPSSNPSGLPTSGTNPTGPGTNPDGSTDPNSQSCFGQGWSWNPVSWVYVPVKCALLWAFKPNPASWGVSDLVAQAKARPPLSVALGVGASLGAVVDGFKSAGGCGLLADFGPISGKSGAITCSAVRSVPGYAGLYALVQVGLVGLTGLGLFQLFGGYFTKGK